MCLGKVSTHYRKCRSQRGNGNKFSDNPPSFLLCKDLMEEYPKSQLFVIAAHFNRNMSLRKRGSKWELKLPAPQVDRPDDTYETTAHEEAMKNPNIANMIKNIKQS